MLKRLLKIVRFCFVTVLISVWHFTHDVYTAFITPILPLLRDTFSLSYTEAGLIPVVLRIPSLFNVVIGSFVDRWNLNAVVMLTPTFTALFVCLMGNAPSYRILLALAFLAGISSSLFHVPSPSLLQKAVPKRLGIAMSAFQIGGEFARTAGPLIVLAAIKWWGLDRIYYLVPAAMAVSALFAFVLKRVPFEPSKAAHSISGSILHTLRSQPVVFLAIFGIMLQKAFSATILANYLTLYLDAQGESLWFAGGSLSVLQGAAVVGVAVTGPLSDVAGKRNVLLVLTCAVPFLMLCFVSASSPAVFFPLLVLLGIFGFSSTPVILTLIQSLGFTYPSIANGIYMTMSFLVSSIMILAAGWVADAFSIDAMFQWFSWASFCGIPFVFLLPKKS